MNAWTNIKMEKSGKVAEVILLSMYELPSGRQIPLNDNEIKEERFAIGQDIDAVANAKQQLPNLERLRNEVRKSLRQAANQSVGILKDQLAARLGEIEVMIANANGWIADERAILQDEKEQTRVEELAQELKKCQDLAYRFYMLVEFKEVNLLQRGKSL